MITTKCIAEEINGQLVNSESKFLVTTSDLLEKVKAASEGLDIKIIVIGENVANNPAVTPEHLASLKTVC